MAAAAVRVLATSCCALGGGIIARRRQPPVVAVLQLLLLRRPRSLGVVRQPSLRRHGRRHAVLVAAGVAFAVDGVHAAGVPRVAVGSMPVAAR